MHKVNESLPKDRQFSTFWWYLSKSLRLSREYRRLFPNGRLLWMHRAFGAAMFACLLCVVWALGFFQLFF